MMSWRAILIYWCVWWLIAIITAVLDSKLGPMPTWLYALIVAGQMVLSFCWADRSILYLTNRFFQK